MVSAGIDRGKDMPPDDGNWNGAWGGIVGAQLPVTVGAPAVGSAGSSETTGMVVPRSDADERKATAHQRRDRVTPAGREECTELAAGIVAEAVTPADRDRAGVIASRCDLRN